MSWQDWIAMAVVLWAGIYVLARFRRWGKIPGPAACLGCTGCRPEADGPPLLSIHPLPEQKRERASGGAARPPLSACGGHDGVGR